MGSQPYNQYDPRCHQPGPSLGGPHPSRDGPGACYPPPTYPFAAPTYGPAPASGGYMPHPSKLSIPGFKMNQTVSARITTDTWVMGVIIGVAHICAKITGRAYVVEFEGIGQLLYVIGASWGLSSYYTNAYWHRKYATRIRPADWLNDLSS